MKCVRPGECRFEPGFDSSMIVLSRRVGPGSGKWSCALLGPVKKERDGLVLNLAYEFELPEIQPAATAYWCGKGGKMAPKTHCAYNQTRECFLGLQVTTADLPYGSVDKYLESLTLKSGEGLWLSPFRGIPVTDLHAPLDLIYLDGDCRVTETVESFPTFRASASSTLQRAYWRFRPIRFIRPRRRREISCCCARRRRWDSDWTASRNPRPRAHCRARFF